MREMDMPGARKGAVIRTVPLVLNALLAVWWAFGVVDRHERLVAGYGDIRSWSGLGLVLSTAALVLLYAGAAVLVHVGIRRPLGHVRDVWQPRLGLDGLLSFATTFFLAVATVSTISAAAEASVVGLAIGIGALSFVLPLALTNPLTVVDEGGVRRWVVGTWLPLVRSFPRGSFAQVALVQLRKSGASSATGYRVEGITTSGKRVTLRVVPGAAGPGAANEEAARWSAALGIRSAIA